MSAHHILEVEKNITTSLLNGNVEVINEPKTGKTFIKWDLQICRSQV